jgi:exonuclease SbcD
VQQLKELLQGVSILVVVGDMAETRPCCWQEQGVVAREELRALCRENGVELVEISGNHDPDTPILLASFWGGRVVAMHGHALHKEVAPWSWEYLHNKNKCRRLIEQYRERDHNLTARLELSREMCQLTTPILRREGIRNKYLRGFMHCFWPPQRPLNIVLSWLTCRHRAEHFARTYFPDCEVMILGHFHRFGNWKHHRHILNTGAWFRHATPYCVDMRDGQVLAYRKVQLKSPSHT